MRPHAYYVFFGGSRDFRESGNPRRRGLLGAEGLEEDGIGFDETGRFEP